MDFEGVTKLWLIGVGITLSSIGLFDRDGEADFWFSLLVAALWPVYILLGALKFLVRSFYR